LILMQVSTPHHFENTLDIVCRNVILEQVAHRIYWSGYGGDGTPLLCDSKALS
jgi:hypothetical protein